MLVGWIAIAAVALEAIGLAVGVVVWGVPALIVVGPVLLATIVMTVVLWLTVVPQRLLRAHLNGAPARWHVADDLGGSHSGSGADHAPNGSAWPSDAGPTAHHATHHGWYSPSEGGWSGDSSGEGTSSGSWSDSASSDSSSSSSSDSSPSSSSDSSSSSW
jgi:hypothetical protein